MDWNQEICSERWCGTWHILCPFQSERGCKGLLKVWKSSCFLFVCFRDKKEIMDCPLVMPQKDRRYASCQFVFHRATWLLVEFCCHVDPILSFFLGRAWCHWPPWTTWSRWTKGRKSALSHKLKTVCLFAQEVGVWLDSDSEGHLFFLTLWQLVFTLIYFNYLCSWLAIFT